MKRIVFFSVFLVFSIFSNAYAQEGFWKYLGWSYGEVKRGTHPVLQTQKVDSSEVELPILIETESVEAEIENSILANNDGKLVEKLFVIRPFETDKYVLTADLKRQIQEAIGFVKNKDGYLMLVFGGADIRSTGTYGGGNLELSARRAESVKEYLVKKGIPSARILARGYGAVIDKKTRRILDLLKGGSVVELGELSQDRRAEIWVIYTTGSSGGIRKIRKLKIGNVILQPRWVAFYDYNRKILCVNAHYLSGQGPVYLAVDENRWLTNSQAMNGEELKNYEFTFVGATEDGGIWYATRVDIRGRRLTYVRIDNELIWAKYGHLYGNEKFPYIQKDDKGIFLRFD